MALRMAATSTNFCIHGGVLFQEFIARETETKGECDGPEIIGPCMQNQERGSGLPNPGPGLWSGARSASH